MSIEVGNVSFDIGKCPINSLNVVRGMDKPLNKQTGINLFSGMLTGVREICNEYDLRVEAFNLFLHIVQRWEMGMGSTVYSLRLRDDKGDVTATHYKVTRLYKRGLIEVVGVGKINAARVYAPSQKGNEVVNRLISTISNK